MFEEEERTTTVPLRSTVLPKSAPANEELVSLIVER